MKVKIKYVGICFGVVFLQWLPGCASGAGGVDRHINLREIPAGIGSPTSSAAGLRTATRTLKGKFVKANESLSCRPLNGKVYLYEYFDLQGGVRVSNNTNTNSQNYNYLATSNGEVLSQGRLVAKGDVSDGAFSVSWNEVPYSNPPWRVNTFHVSPNTIDGSNVEGYRKVTAYRRLQYVFEIGGNRYYVVDIKVHPPITYWMNERDKDMGELTIERCVALL